MARNVRECESLPVYQQPTMLQLRLSITYATRRLGTGEQG